MSKKKPTKTAPPPVPHIRYHPVYGGHPILRKTAADAYAAVKKFLEACTDWDGTWPSNTISGWSPDEFIKPDERNSAILKSFRAKLGTPTPGIIIAPVGGLAINTASDWRVPAELHDWAVQRVLEAPPAKRGWPDPVSCTCALDFKLRVPNGRVLPGQAGPGAIFPAIRSEMLLSIASGTTSAFFDLVFPFAEPGPEFLKYVASIRPYLPIRLAKGNFKRWVLKKNGTELMAKRIDRGLFEDL
jgi:hypothetical protein